MIVHRTVQDRKCVSFALFWRNKQNTSDGFERDKTIQGIESNDFLRTQCRYRRA